MENEIVWKDSDGWYDSRSGTVLWGGEDAWAERSDHLRIVTLEVLKRHLRVDFTDDDGMITMYGIAAEKTILGMTHRTPAQLAAENQKRTGDTVAEFPQTLYIAILIYAAQLYSNREPVTGLNVNQVPYTLMALVKPWIKLSTT